MLHCIGFFNSVAARAFAPATRASAWARPEAGLARSFPVRRRADCTRDSRDHGREPRKPPCAIAARIPPPHHGSQSGIVPCPRTERAGAGSPALATSVFAKRKSLSGSPNGLFSGEVERRTLLRYAAPAPANFEARSGAKCREGVSRRRFLASCERCAIITKFTLLSESHGDGGQPKCQP